MTAYYSPTVTQPDKIYCTRGGFIPNFEFDPREYNFNMLQMEDTDTNQVRDPTRARLVRGGTTHLLLCAHACRPSRS